LHGKHIVVGPRRGWRIDYIRRPFATAVRPATVGQEQSSENPDQTHKLEDQLSFERHWERSSLWAEVKASFEVAAFGFDGELIGTGTRQLDQLSPRWLSACDVMLRENGAVFRKSLGAQLSHIEIQLTSADGAALGMFFVNGALAISAAYFRGESATIEASVMSMFVDSLRNIPAVQEAAESPLPFEALLSVETRPLVALVFWAPSDVNEGDHDLVRELSTHFAGAYLYRAPDSSGTEKS
jgi:hypothetical protein